jgi:hypothetical protein
LLLISEDPRTDEEKEYDLQKAAEEKTYAMFDSLLEDKTSIQPNHIAGITPDTQILALVPRGVVAVVAMQQMIQAIIKWQPTDAPNDLMVDGCIMNDMRVCLH